MCTFQFVVPLLYEVNRRQLGSRDGHHRMREYFLHRHGAAVCLQYAHWLVAGRLPHPFPQNFSASKLALVPVNRAIALDFQDERGVAHDVGLVLGRGPGHQHLRVRHQERLQAIVIGPQEAWAIDRRLKGHATPRPMTHDLLANVIEQLGGEIDYIEINNLEAHTFFATIHIGQSASSDTGSKSFTTS